MVRLVRFISQDFMDVSRIKVVCHCHCAHTRFKLMDLSYHFLFMLTLYEYSGMPSTAEYLLTQRYCEHSVEYYGCFPIVLCILGSWTQEF